MAINPYQKIEISADYEIYEFDSIGKERLRKRVKFDLIGEREQIYNLTLCTVFLDGTEDCKTASRNGDMDIVLETAAQVAMMYIDRFPDRKVFFRGSDGIRSRKYQIGIAKYLDMAMKDFIVEGVIINEDEKILLREFFQADINYTGFIFTRKK